MSAIISTPLSTFSNILVRTVTARFVISRTVVRLLAGICISWPDNSTKAVKFRILTTPAEIGCCWWMRLLLTVMLSIGTVSELISRIIVWNFVSTSIPTLGSSSPPTSALPSTSSSSPSSTIPSTSINKPPVHSSTISHPVLSMISIPDLCNRLRKINPNPSIIYQCIIHL